ncbi:tetratricopeptide repeat protein [Luteimonas qiangzhengi]|uniref:tetratricopeptide repeat protein n=1 Tax=Luteimonas sp. MJ146 TaxID=3129240 RepID=UPI0031BB492E
MTPARWLMCALLIAVLAWAGWGIVDAYRQPDPDARLAQARQLLQQGNEEEAVAIARSVLANDPSHGRAFAVIAAAAGADESPTDASAQTLALYEIAARRAPRDIHVRGWLGAHHLQAGDFNTAMPHLDALLTVSAQSREQALPLIAQLAADRRFAEVLAAHLAERPRWRTTLLRAATRLEDPTASDHLHATLVAQDALPRADASRWLDAMLREGRWGAAYAHWISGLPQRPDSLPLLHNGDFAQPISSYGFDWRLRRTNGVVSGRVDAPGGGRALRLSFLGRNVGRTGLEQPLLLAPGRYSLQLRARTSQLRSQRGLEWQLTCSDNRTRIAVGATIRSQTQWTPLQLEFEVPAENCEGQWLRLVNPAPRGAAQALRGEVQLTDMAITRLPE